MTRTSLVALLASLPALAFAQLGAGAGALDAARGARDTSDDANAKLVRAAEDASAPEATAAGEPAEPRDDDAIDLGGDALPPEGSAVGSSEPGAAVPPPDTYTVRPGDTLWDLSGRFLNNPWYWPKLWSYNPEITNAHWIYPGNLLRFFPGSDEAPARVEAIAELSEEPEALEVPRELEDFSRAELGDAPVDDDVVAVAGPYKIGYVAPKALLVRHDSFVTRRELEESGALTASFHEKHMLSTLDQAYAQFKGAAPVAAGETYVLYKTDRAVHHPVTRELLGYQSVVLGAARVMKVDDKAATIEITQAFEPIERGTLLGPWTERFLRPVARTPNGRALEGRIVAAQVDVVTQVGEHHVVFIDKGREDGVEEGNLFRVVRSGDPAGKPIGAARWDERFPKETVGDLLVIDVKPNASAALVTRSLTELSIGDRVEMRAEGGAGGR
jgi:hypothetical protein